MRKSFYLALTALAFTACSQDDVLNQDNNEVLTFEATMETSDANSRTSLGEGKTVVWSEGDTIAAYLKNQKALEFTLASGKNTTKGTFRYTTATTAGEKAHYAAIYPFKAARGLKGAGNSAGYTFTLNIPVIQYYRENSFYGQAFPMVAMSNDTNLNFKNVCGVLKLQIKGNETITHITVKGNNNEITGGEGTVLLHNKFEETTDLIWTAAKAKKPKKETSLSCENKVNEEVKGVVLDPTTPKSFYISLPPVEFTKGITVTLTNLTGVSTTKTVSVPVTITRNQILNMPVLEYNK